MSELTLSIDVGRGQELDGFCITDGQHIIYIGTDVEKVRGYNFETVNVSEPIDDRKDLLDIILGKTKE